MDRLWTDQGLESLTALREMVFYENICQLKKWGVQERSPFEWMAYLTEEVGELAQAISDEMVYRDGSHKDIVDEAIQVATLALKIAEMAQDERESLLASRNP